MFLFGRGFNTPASTKLKLNKHLQNRILINNQIRAREVRVIDEKGGNLGVFSIEEALRLAQERETDLIEVTANVNPPICKLMDYGKFRYIEEKKNKSGKQVHRAMVREIKVRIGTSNHDLEVKAKKALEFLEQGDKVKIELALKGREKYLD